MCDNSNNSPLQFACAFGHFECVKLLLDKGADLLHKNIWKYSAIEISYLKNHSGIFNYLLNSKYFDVNLKFGNGSCCLLNIFLQIRPNSYNEIASILKNKKADPNICDDNEQNALHYLSNFTYKIYILNFLTKQQKESLNEENTKTIKRNIFINSLKSKSC